MNNENVFFGRFGGKYVAEVLRSVLDSLEMEFQHYWNDEKFKKEFQSLLKDFVGRPTPLIFAENVSQILGGAQIFVKLEGLSNTGAHKINNALGQCLLAKKMGKKNIIAETGAGQHGVATAAACAKLGLPCTIFMGAVDVKRQQPNVATMELYGAKVVSVWGGTQTLKDAVNEAMRHWASDPENTHYVFGSALGPAPFPHMVREFQSVMGEELKAQMKEKNIEMEKVEALVACVGGGSNAIGFFSPFLNQKKPRLVAVEAGGKGKEIGENAVRMSGVGKEGILQGYKSRFLLDEDGQALPTHSVSAGLDYCGIGPQLAFLGEEKRIEFTSQTDEAVLSAVQFFAKNEGLLFALESAHAAAYAIETAPHLPKDKILILNMSGRGDKDLFITCPYFRPEKWENFLEEELLQLKRAKK